MNERMNELLTRIPQFI